MSDKTLTNVGVGVTVGAAVGGVAVAGAFLAVGLTFGGPIAGCWFAANMGAGLVSGSGMALLQSAAMTTGAYYTGAAVGGVAGGAIGYAATGKKDPQEPSDPAEPTGVQLVNAEQEDENENEKGDEK